MYEFIYLQGKYTRILYNIFKPTNGCIHIHLGTYVHICIYICKLSPKKTQPYQDVLLFFNSLLVFLFANTLPSICYDFIFLTNKNNNEPGKNAVENEAKWLGVA